MPQVMWQIKHFPYRDIHEGAWPSRVVLVLGPLPRTREPPWDTVKEILGPRLYNTGWIQAQAIAIAALAEPTP